MKKEIFAACTTAVRVGRSFLRCLLQFLLQFLRSYVLNPQPAEETLFEVNCESVITMQHLLEQFPLSTESPAVNKGYALREADKYATDDEVATWVTVKNRKITSIIVCSRPKESWCNIVILALRADTEDNAQKTMTDLLKRHKGRTVIYIAHPHYPEDKVEGWLAEAPSDADCILRPNCWLYGLSEWQNTALTFEPAPSMK